MGLYEEIGEVGPAFLAVEFLGDVSEIWEFSRYGIVHCMLLLLCRVEKLVDRMLVALPLGNFLDME